jgi:hypothetical protein
LGVCTCNKLLEWGYIKVTFLATGKSVINKPLIDVHQPVDIDHYTLHRWSVYI